MAFGLVELEGTTEEFVALLSVTGPNSRRSGVGSPTKSQEGAPPDALEVRNVEYGEALPYLHHPGRARAVRGLVQCHTDKREGWSGAVAPAVAVRTVAQEFRTGSVQTNWMRIPDMPSIIQVATDPAATAPPTRSRSASALWIPCAIMITRAPDVRCDSTKNTASQ